MARSAKLESVELDGVGGIAPEGDGPSITPVGNCLLGSGLGFPFMFPTTGWKTCAEKLLGGSKSSTGTQK